MLGLAVRRCTEVGAVVGPVLRVAGCFDVPLAAKRLLERDDVDAVVAVGAVVKGETGHDELIANACAAALAALAIESDKPVGLGITGPGMTLEQAKARVEAGASAVDAVVRLAGAFEATDKLT